MDILKKAAEEIEIFERPSVATSKEMMKEIERLRFLVTASRHILFKKKLITFDEVRNWQI